MSYSPRAIIRHLTSANMFTQKLMALVLYVLHQGYQISPKVIKIISICMRHTQIFEVPIIFGEMRKAIDFNLLLFHWIKKSKYAPLYSFVSDTHRHYETPDTLYRRQNRGYTSRLR